MSSKFTFLVAATASRYSDFVAVMYVQVVVCQCIQRLSRPTRLPAAKYGQIGYIALLMFLIYT